MFSIFFKITDNFLSLSIKSSFEKVENNYLYKNIDISQELKNLELDPLSCTIGNPNKFESSVKVYLKIIIGFFFVFLPATLFSFVSYISNIPYSYSFVLTLIIALLAASRIEELSKRYTQNRIVGFQY